VLIPEPTTTDSKIFPAVEKLISVVPQPNSSSASLFAKFRHAVIYNHILLSIFTAYNKHYSRKDRVIIYFAGVCSVFGISSGLIQAIDEEDYMLAILMGIIAILISRCFSSVIKFFFKRNPNEERLKHFETTNDMKEIVSIVISRLEKQQNSKTLSGYLAFVVLYASNGYFTVSY
jgi:hypothetical protein